MNPKNYILILVIVILLVGCQITDEGPNELDEKEEPVELDSDDMIATYIYQCGMGESAEIDGIYIYYINYWGAVDLPQSPKEMKCDEMMQYVDCEYLCNRFYDDDSPYGWSSLTVEDKFYSDIAKKCTCSYSEFRPWKRGDDRIII